MYLYNSYTYIYLIHAYIFRMRALCNSAALRTACYKTFKWSGSVVGEIKKGERTLSPGWVEIERSLQFV